MLRFRVLGPLEVSDGVGPVDLGGPRQRSLLALLLLSVNRVVSTDALVDALWGEEPPRTATTSLHNAVSQLRRALGPGVLETRPPGYVLRVEEGGLDLAEFERLLARAREEPPEVRARTLREALELWRGPALADVAMEPFAADEVRRLEELRLIATEERLEADLASGRAGDVVAEADALVRRHPYRERLRALLMLALYRADRQAEALQAFHDLRRVLDEELGLEPGPELRELHRRILVHDASLRGPGRAQPSAPDPLGEIVRAVLASRLVPVLGLKTAAAAPDPIVAAGQLAQAFGCRPDVARSLARVAQHVTVTHGVGPLYDELDGLYGGDYPPGAIHRLLASLPPVLRDRGLPHQLIVTTGYDRTLERAFAEAGEPLDVVSYVALGPDRGKFLHVGPDGAARVIVEPNIEIGLTTDERTILLKVHGGSDAGSRDRESYVVSEDDYIDLLVGTQPSALLPVGLAARLRRSHFLFLGYELEEWSLRVFLRRLWGEERLAYRSWAIGSTGGEVAAGYWRLRGVEPIDVDLDAFVEELAQHLVAPAEATG